MMEQRTYRVPFPRAVNRRRGAIGLIVALVIVGILAVGVAAYIILHNAKISGTGPSSNSGIAITSSTPEIPAPSPPPAPVASSTPATIGALSNASSTLPPPAAIGASPKKPNPPPSPAAPPVVVLPPPAPVQIVLPPVIPPNLPVVLPAPTSTSVQPNTPQLPPIISIDPQTLVGVLCYFRATYTNRAAGQSVVDPQLVEARGSGVIIGSPGYILTNRHVIRLPEDTTTVTGANGTAIPITIDYQLDHCEAGQLPKGATLPTADEIRTFNPFVQIPVLGYLVQPVFVSPTAGRSAIEIDAADFAVLKITGVTKSGPTFGVSSVPASFPHATLLAIDPYDVMNEEVLTYGFPGDVTVGQGNPFETLTMTGSVGKITQIEVGDAFYANTPLIITASMEVAHGRSGSPLFWRGYVVGIVTFFVGSNRTDSGSVASDAILKALQGTGYLNPF
jgi:Trypsin-like peptidase domain